MEEAHGTFVERQIRLAQERGDFDDLPSTGKPLPGLDGPDDENWWLKGYLRREGLSTEPLLPTPLQLRREIERLPDTVAGLPDEQTVRGVVRELNRRIADCLRMSEGPTPPCTTDGPPNAAQPTPPRAPTVRGAGGGAARPSKRGVRCGRCTQRPVRSERACELGRERVKSPGIQVGVAHWWSAHRSGTRHERIAVGVAPFAGCRTLSRAVTAVVQGAAVTDAV